MKIGLISADKHCKSHIAALRKDGYNVTCLGARPTSIPVSYDALIVRVASISHGGEATARAWAKKTGNPAIYEDGLTGIRRELAALRAAGEAVEEASPPDIFAKLLGCAESYREARPEDGPDEMSKALRGVVTIEHPDLSKSLRRSMVMSITARFFPTTSTATPEKTMPKIALPPYAGSPALWPTDTGWGKVYAEPRVRSAYNEAVEIITDANHLTITSFTNGVKMGVFSRKVKTRWESLLRGKPLTSAFVLFMLIPDLTKMEGMQAYRLITEKGMDSRLRDVVEWALGAQEVVAVPVDPVVNENVTDSGHSKIEADHDPALVVDNTKAIVDLMDDLSTFKNEIRADVAQIGAGLESLSQFSSALEPRIKALEDFRATHERHGQLVADLLAARDSKGPFWESRIESRIKDLETDTSLTSSWGSRIKSLEAGIIMDPEGEAQWKERFAQMKEELRSDISNAFDALAAEQPSGDVSSNPLAALEHVKAALKAAGFKGTLTLTIE